MQEEKYERLPNQQMNSTFEDMQGNTIDDEETLNFSDKEI